MVDFYLCVKENTTFQSTCLCLVHPGLGVLGLSLQQLLVPLEGHGHLLLRPELISQPRGVHHGPLRLVLRHLGLAHHLLEAGVQGTQLLLALDLGPADGLVLAGQVAQALVGVRQFLLHVPPGPVALLQQGPRLLQRVLVGVGSPNVRIIRSSPGGLENCVD